MTKINIDKYITLDRKLIIELIKQINPNIKIESVEFRNNKIILKIK